MGGIICDITKEKDKAARDYFDVQLPHLVEVYATQAKRTHAIVLGCLVFQLPSAVDPKRSRSFGVTESLVPNSAFRVGIPLTKLGDDSWAEPAVANFCTDVLQAWRDSSPANLTINCRRLFAAHWSHVEVQNRVSNPREIFQPLLDFIHLLIGGWVYDPIRRAIVREGEVQVVEPKFYDHKALPAPDPERVQGPRGAVTVYPKGDPEWESSSGEALSKSSSSSKVEEGTDPST